MSKNNVGTPKASGPLVARRDIASALGVIAGAFALSACRDGTAEASENVDTAQLGLSGTNSIYWADTVTDLRALTITATEGAVAILKGYAVPGDGGGGVFVWSTRQAVDDGGTVFNAGGQKSAGWRRLYAVGHIGGGTDGGADGVIHHGPLDVRWFGARCDGTTDDSAKLQLAINAAASVGGGTVVLPSGVIYIGATTISLPPKVALRGQGSTATKIKSSSPTRVIESLYPINGSAAAHNIIELLSIQNTNASASDGLIVQRAAAYFHVRDCSLSGGRWGIVFDQTQIADIARVTFDSHIGAGWGACIWLTNGPDYTASAFGGFTNIITIDGCQFNGACDWGIVDDGGMAHIIRSCNFANATKASMRICGAIPVTVEGCNVEGSPYAIQFELMSLGGPGNGNTPRASGWAIASIIGNHLTGMTRAVNVVVAGRLSFGGNQFSSPSGPAIVGAGNAAIIEEAWQNFPNGPTSFSDRGYTYNVATVATENFPRYTNPFARLTNAPGPFSLGGFVNGLEGTTFTVYNTTNQPMTIKNESAASLAENRILTMQGADVTLPARPSTASFRYDATSDRWLLVATS